MPEQPAERQAFPTTRWSLVAKANQHEVLDHLLRQYQPALRAYLLYHHRMQPADADDLLQAFITDKIIQKRLIEHADQRRGRFRSFLLTVLNNYRRDASRHARTARRSPANQTVPFDDSLASEAAAGEPATSFEIAWAREVLVQAIAAMQAQCQRENREALWQLFEQRILRPLIDNEPPLDYDTLVENLGYRSPAEAHNALVTAKRMYQRSLRDALAVYATSEWEIENELRELRCIASRAGWAASCRTDK
ncbi:MAG: hypothetical protein WD534_03045 [Phycisphaeraceae bacterium]